MAVTRTSAAERRRKETTGLSSTIPGLRPKMARDRETLLLGGGIAVFLLGLCLVYLAVTRPFGELEAQLAGGQVVAVSNLREPEQLVPLLGFLSEPAERSYVARQLYRRIQEGPLPNIGELARLRVPVSEIEDDSRLPMLRRRVAGLRESRGGELREGAEVVLLSSGQLQELKSRLIVRTPSRYRTQLALWTGLFLLAFVATHLVFRLRGFTGDQLLLPVTLVLTGLSLLVMISVRDPLRDTLHFRDVVQGVAVGMVLLILASLIDVLPRLRRLTFAPLAVALVLSALLILFGKGPGTSDAKVNLFGFQPVEAVKILVVLFLAGYLHDRWEFLRELSEKRAGLAGTPSWMRVPKLSYVLPPLLAMGLVLVFFFLQKDLGPALILSFLFLLVYSVARGRPVMLVFGAALMVTAFFVAYKIGYPDTVTRRLGMWLSPWDNAHLGGDHLAQSIWTLASGALTGTGLGLGHPGQVPAIHTDMVLAALGEELGFIGLLAIFGLYTVLVWRGLQAARQAEGTYSFFLALGLSLLLALQILLIAGGVVGLFPLSGVVSPFLSYGRSAMLANFLIVGLLLAVSSKPSNSEQVRRFDGAVRWAALGLTALGIAILAKAAFIQVVRPDHYLTQSALVLHGDNKRYFDANPRLEAIAQTIPRGSILDRNGIPLATSDPQELERQRATFERLGVSLERTESAGKRAYPFGGRTFHLLGDRNNQVNWGASNTSYAERDSRIRLQGYDDYAEVVEVTQPNGDVTREIRQDYRELVPLLRHQHQPGHRAVEAIKKKDRNLRMSIDARLQLRAADILKRQAQQAGHGAAAVVVDAETGDLLASVSYPWPDRLPVELDVETSRKTKTLIDRARYGIYPPGSTFKLVTAMAALRESPAVAGQTFPCEALGDGRVGHRVRGFGKPIRDDLTVHVPHGQVDMEKGIGQSCNAYFAQLGTYEVGPELLLETAKLMDITVAVPNTPEETAKSLPQASYGQGEVTATPFKMARVAATVANGGVMPYGRWVIDDSNERKEQPVEILTGPPIGIIQRAMRRVTTTGTAKFLADVQPAIAGKTGTAEVQGKLSHSWFVGFAPYGAPEGGRRIAVAVIVEHGGYGGRLAAPAAGEILRAAAELGLTRAEAPPEAAEAP
jgi:cell division protein FtsW (lipid II flippase)/cell division protein FtsI/penicillin-binding protein 2